MRELESAFALATTTLGAITATHGLLSGNTNATIVGMGCVLAGVFSSEMISLKDTIRRGHSTIIASLISKRFGKTLNDEVEAELKKAKKTEKKK